jgi:hypothetical protein
MLTRISAPPALPRCTMRRRLGWEPTCCPWSMYPCRDRADNHGDPISCSCWVANCAHRQCPSAPERALAESSLDYTHGHSSSHSCLHAYA